MESSICADALQRLVKTMGNNLPILCMYRILEAIVDISFDTESPEHIRNLRMDAVLRLPGYLSSYVKRELNPDVIEVVCNKKLEFIRQATTSAEIHQIMSPPRPRWHAGKVICDSPYHIDAEELLGWSYFSPCNLMPYEAQERALSLFEKVFGCSVEEYKGGKPNGKEQN